MKKRVIISSLIVLSLLMLVSIGFASWVINNEHKGTSTGNFEAYDAVETSFITVSNPTQNIVFGAHTNETATNSWLSDSALAPQSLSVTFTVQLQNKEANSADVVLTLTPSLVYKAEGDDHDAGDEYTTAQTYFAGPTFTCATAAFASIPTTGDNVGKLVFTDNGTATITVTYAWGEAFGNKNPWKYYNDQTYTAELAADAKTKLNALDALVDLVSFKVTVSD